MLSEAPDRKLRTGELAELLAWEKSRVSHQVARMEARGLLERTECDTDGRGTWVGLTDEGRRILLGSMREHAAAIREPVLRQPAAGREGRDRRGVDAHHRAHQPGGLRHRRREGHGRIPAPPPDVGRVSGSTRTNAGRPGTERADVVIVGGGHNGLAAAAYLASAGKSVVVLERLDGFGGAAVSAPAFPGVDARLSRYSYLVSLLPQTIIRDLKLDIRLARRRYSSYTPLPGHRHRPARRHRRRGGDGRVLRRDRGDPGCRGLAALLRRHRAGRPRPVPDRDRAARHPQRDAPAARRRREARALWDDLIENPIGTAIERDFADDLVRGVVLTDALIGTFAPNVDETLAGNRCFLYHVIGGGTGDWDVPVGGMGAVSGALWRAAVDAGAKLVNDAEVTAITPDGEVSYRTGGERGTSTGSPATTVLANVAPYELSRLLGAHGTPVERPRVRRSRSTCC